MMKNYESRLSNYGYICTIIKALNRFYQNDYLLLENENYTNEMTYSFRLAMYLARELETQNHNNNKAIDCEYHGMLDPTQEKYLRKCIPEYGKCRPDIIYHTRSKAGVSQNKDDNCFAIEVKKKAVGKDKDKAKGYINALKYKESFCIYNWGRKYVTITAFRRSLEGIVTDSFRYKFDVKTSNLLFDKLLDGDKNG